MKINLLFLLLFLSFYSCTHSVHLVHVGDFEPYQKITAGEMIQAQAEQFVILGFTKQTEYINEARQQLMAQCPKGRIQGPVTRLSTSHGFFSWTHKVFMQALCIQ